MKKLRMLLLASGLALTTSCANQTYRVDVGAMFAKASGDIALQNAGGSLVLHDNQNDLQDNMGLGDTEASPYVRLQMDQEKHRVRVHGFGLDAEGTGTLAGDFGGLLAGSQVTTSMEFFGIGANYSYEILRDENYRVGVGVALGFYSLDVAARSSAGREAVETDVLVPMPYGEAEVSLGPVLVGGNFGFMSAHIRDANGIFLDGEAYAKLPIEEFEVMLGYRYVTLDAYGEATSRDFDADIVVQGFFLGGGIRF